ncbi:MAG: dTDP-4-dehydrorhamnose 3,5-epimerase family protein [Bryobacterales bacterium]
MLFFPQAVEGVRLIETEPVGDDRGYFARIYCLEELRAVGVEFRIEQASVAFSHSKHTLRGLHYQEPPHAEQKLVRCIRGEAFVAVFDMREDSETKGRWCGVRLSQQNRCSLYVPEGCAQGYQTLQDETEMLYAMSRAYAPASARGVRYDDPAAGIEWPAAPTVISDRDLAWPLLGGR